MATQNAQTEFKSIQDCPQFLRELVAEQLGVPLDKINGWLDTEDDLGMERIKFAFFDIGRRIKALQKDEGGVA